MFSNSSFILGTGTSSSLSRWTLEPTGTERNGRTRATHAHPPSPVIFLALHFQQRSQLKDLCGNAVRWHACPDLDLTDASGANKNSRAPQSLTRRHLVVSTEQARSAPHSALAWHAEGVPNSCPTQ